MVKLRRGVRFHGDLGDCDDDCDSDDDDDKDDNDNSIQTNKDNDE